jgi:uncharacterized protein YycO
MKLPAWLIAFFGKLYFFSTPFFFVYNPHVHKIKGHEARQICDHLIPGDILLSKSDGYISSRTIPGFWSHAAIYVGNNNVIHAIGEGVIIEDVLAFVRTDHIVVLRFKKISNEEILAAISKAHKMVDNKVKYDYTFTDNNGMVYCTEAVNNNFNNTFRESFEIVAGNSILTPEGIYNSTKLYKVIEFRH